MSTGGRRRSAPPSMKQVAGGRAGSAPQESRLACLADEAGRRYLPLSIIKGETSLAVQLVGIRSLMVNSGTGMASYGLSTSPQEFQR